MKDMKIKPKIYLMIGLSASGKSTIAKQIAEENNCIIISSDSIRGEICESVIDQTKNEEVFKIFNQRIKENLLKGNNVIADATNISMKSRRGILNNLYKVECDKIAYIVPKLYEQCMEDNIYKDYPVTHHVITKQMMNFQIPFYEEGFDEIIIHDFNYGVDNNYLKDIKSDMDKFEQLSPYHNETVGRHCDLTTNEFMKYTSNRMYILGSIYHDMSKMYTQKFDEDGIAHYYQHENVGAYILLSNKQNIVDDNELLDMLFLINYHMMPMDWISEKTDKRYRKIFGNEKFEMLKIFNKCDKFRLTD